MGLYNFVRDRNKQLIVWATPQAGRVQVGAHQMQNTRLDFYPCHGQLDDSAHFGCSLDGFSKDYWAWLDRGCCLSAVHSRSKLIRGWFTLLNCLPDSGLVQLWCWSSNRDLMPPLCVGSSPCGKAKYAPWLAQVRMGFQGAVVLSWGYLNSPEQVNWDKFQL